MPKFSQKPNNINTRIEVSNKSRISRQFYQNNQALKLKRQRFKVKGPFLPIDQSLNQGKWKIKSSRAKDAKSTNTETSTEFIQRFLRLASFLGAAAGTEEEKAKNFQWGLRRSTLNHLMCMSYTDVAQVANTARNYEILHERDDDDTERPDKRQKSGDRHQPTSQQSSHKNHGHNNDRHGSDRRSGGDNHRSNNYSGSNNRNSDYGRDQRNKGQQSNRSAISGSQQSRGPSEGYSYPVCTTCGRRHPGECRRAAGTCFKCGQAGHLQKDCKKNTTASTSGQADKKPGASGRVFAITEGHAANTSEHHATIDCRSYRVIFGDIHAPEFIYHGSLLGKSMQIISALQARTLLSHGCEGFLATIHDTTSDVSSIHDQPIVSEFPDVFPDELPVIPPVREVEFNIELIPGIKRYIDTKPNHELIHYCLENPSYELGWKGKEVSTSEGSPITRTKRVNKTYKNVSQEIRDHLNTEAEAVQIILTGIDNDIYSTVNDCLNACEMWKAIERLKHGESINVQDLGTNLYWEFRKFTSQDGETLESYYSRFYKIMNELSRNQCKVTNHQVNV
nr:zinc finger, CCHC-type, retrotransposon Gag domain protein [Tanacetum cinerariifolium]